MPQLQTVNFGEDPYANAMGTFARNALGTLNEKAGQRRNQDIFKKIQENYGPDAPPEKIFKDVLNAENLDEGYKRNLLSEIKDYATLSTKKDKTGYDDAMLDIRKEELNIKKNKAKQELINGKPITAYQKAALKNADARLKIEEDKIARAAKSENVKLPQLIDKYTTNALKDSIGSEKVNPRDKGEMNGFIQQQMTDPDDPKDLNTAFKNALEYIQARREKINDVKITEKPVKWTGGAESPEVVERSQDKAYAELEAMYDQDGIDSKRDLKAIAKRAGWSDMECDQMVNKILQRAGKKVSPKKQDKNTGSVDDILFG